MIWPDDPDDPLGYRQPGVRGAQTRGRFYPRTVSIPRGLRGNQATPPGKIVAV